MEFFLGGERGTPGIAIYRKGANLGAVVSTGNLTWELEVVGSVPKKHTWTNIAVRWDKPSVETAEEYDEALSNHLSKQELGGLELFLNMESYGHQIFPEQWGCAYDQATATVDCQDPLPDPKDGFDPPEMMLGCHRTMENPTERMLSGGRFDELAVWNKQLEDSEMPLFMGGYRERDDSFHHFTLCNGFGNKNVNGRFSEETLNELSADELLALMVYVDMAEVAQAKAVFDVVSTIVDGGSDDDEAEFQNIYPESDSTEATTEEGDETGTGTGAKDIPTGLLNLRA